MTTNQSGKWLYVNPVGAVHVGDDPPPPSGSTVLVAPGGTLDADLVKRYRVETLLAAPSGKVSVPRDAAGAPLVVKGGRSYAADVLPDDDEGKVAALEAAEQEQEQEQEEKKVGKGEGEAAGTHNEPADAADPPSTKALRLGDIEDKAVSPPAARKPAARPSTRGK